MAAEMLSAAVEDNGIVTQSSESPGVVLIGATVKKFAGISSRMYDTARGGVVSLPATMAGLLRAVRVRVHVVLVVVIVTVE